MKVERSPIRLLKRENRESGTNWEARAKVHFRLESILADEWLEREGEPELTLHSRVRSVEVEEFDQKGSFEEWQIPKQVVER